LLRDETGFFEYAQVARSTDEAIGELVRFVKNDPYFSKNTAIIIRPEFGRDDEINLYGEIHHSEGYYYCYRSASIWAGPDFKPGVTDLVVNRLDFAPTVAALFNAPAPYSGGQIREELWASHVGYKGKYRPYTPA
jgi:predicted AlkP superfamily pyrophosphatase or phosphodiesterase